MSEFDPNQFLDATTTEESKKRPLLPVGDYIGIVGEPKVQSGMQKKDPTKAWQAFNIPVEIDLGMYPEARSLLGLDKVILYAFVGFDIAADGRGIDYSPGKSIALMRWRMALNMNTAGVPFRPRDMQGRPIKCRVGHRMPDPRPGEGQPELVDEISAVAKP